MRRYFTITYPVALFVILGSFHGVSEVSSQILYMDQHAYQVPTDYNRNIPPGKNTTVYIGVNVNRVSGVDENKEEITLDVFLQVSWTEPRLNVPSGKPFIDLPWEFRQLIWTPDLYIWQLQTLKILSVLQEMASLRLYSNGTVSVSIGSTISIKCEMDFVLYPLDVQNCAIDFGSYKYTTEDVRFEWREVTPFLGLAGEQRREFRLPKYVVTFVTDKSEHSAARLQITLSRELRSYLLESYLPSSLFVVMSWGSFCVIPEIVPGRMVLLVTTLLSLVTMFDTVSTNSPDALELKCLDVWLISCTIFVFLALLEYFVVLFGIRYDKAWSRRRVDIRRAASAAQLVPPAPPAPAPVHLNHAQRLSTPVSATPTSPPTAVPTQTSVGAPIGAPTAAPTGEPIGVPIGAPVGAPIGPPVGAPIATQTPTPPPQGRMFTQQLSTEDDGLKQQLAHSTITRDSPILEARPPPGSPPGSFMKRMSQRLDRGVMFCGAQHGALDRYSLMCFPVCFVFFAVIYWTTYLTEAYRAANK